MPGLDGVEATRRLVDANARARILVLTTFDLDEYVYAAIRAGASGFLLKDVQPAELADAIRVVAAGNSLFGPLATQRLLERFTPPPAAAGRTLTDLTEREREILRLIASGLSNAELASELHLGETTVKTHRLLDVPQTRRPRPSASGHRCLRRWPCPTQTLTPSSPPAERPRRLLDGSCDDE